jgi:hypothetical protein
MKKSRFLDPARTGGETKSLTIDLPLELAECARQVRDRAKACGQVFDVSKVLATELARIITVVEKDLADVEAAK